MSLKINRLELRITTDKGLYGTRLEFKSGLNVFWADNSMGKSTSVQAIIYALGLEKMLSPQGAIPLPHVMTDYVEDGAEEIPVLGSSVYLEIENNKGRVLTVKRSVVGGDDPKLISTWDGPLLSNKEGAFEQKNYFVRDPGAAVREAGFHRLLADFLEWELPFVKRFKGDPCPLYLECIFPLLVVEQKRGWTGIQANLPTYFGIRDVASRAIEFLADLDASDIARDRENLSIEEDSLKSKWTQIRGSLENSAIRIGGRLQNIPEAPTIEWPPLLPPAVQFPNESENWEDLRTEIKRKRKEFEIHQDHVIPTVENVAAEVAEELELKRVELQDAEEIYLELEREIEIERKFETSLKHRLRALEDDRRKNKDILKLRELGAKVDLSSNLDLCPTCSQPVSDVLMPSNADISPMSVEDNVKFIEAQIETFRDSSRNSQAAIQSKIVRSTAMKAKVNDLKSTIRSLRTTLVSDNRAPSIADIKKGLSLEQRIEELAKLEDLLNDATENFRDFAERWIDLQSRKKALKDAGGLSDSDENKIQKLERSYKSQLSEYKLKSVQPGSISISRETYKPVREGFNLGFDLSASDNIRSIWAYLLAFVELARSTQTNHPGLLILDEPRQQETSPVSFAGFLRRLSKSVEFDQQVIFATSEPLNQLKPFLADVPHHMIEMEGRVIKKLDQ